MKEIILIGVIVGLFIFFFYFLYILFLKKSKNKSEIKNENKEGSKTEHKKEDIPEILKEVTTGNYMYDLSKNAKINGIEMEENSNIEEPVKYSNVEEAFDEIEDIGDELDDDIDIEVEEIEELEDELLDDIEEDFQDDTLLGEEIAREKKKNKNILVEEYKGLSKEMKALIIANFLEKKHKD